MAQSGRLNPLDRVVAPRRVASPEEQCNVSGEMVIRRHSGLPREEHRIVVEVGDPAEGMIIINKIAMFVGLIAPFCNISR